jgi:hypothetical protein
VLGEKRLRQHRPPWPLRYNVQVAVETEHHLIVTHEVTNSGSDRAQLANVAKQAKAVLQTETLEAVADRGYFNSPEILACHEAGITVTLPKPMTSGAKSDGRFGKQDFVYIADQDVYRCPAGERLTYRYTNEEDGTGPIAKKLETEQLPGPDPSERSLQRFHTTKTHLCLLTVNFAVMHSSVLAQQCGNVRFPPRRGAHEATRVHHAARRSGSVAVHCARAAVCDACDRIPRQWIS